MASWFLLSELVTGKCEDLEGRSPKLIAELGKLGIVKFGQTSLGGYIDEEQDGTLVIRELDLSSVNLLIRNVTDARHVVDEGSGATRFMC